MATHQGHALAATRAGLNMSSRVWVGGPCPLRPCPRVRAHTSCYQAATCSAPTADAAGMREGASTSQPPPQQSPWGGVHASGGVALRPAGSDDYWAVADCHCTAFYPRAGAFWGPLLRLDRVMALQLGRRALAACPALARSLAPGAGTLPSA